MMLVFPVAANERLVGSAALVASHQNKLLFATALHILGESADIRIAIPPHEGNCSIPQIYPLQQTQALAAAVVSTDPFADLAVLAADSPPTAHLPLPKIATAPGLIGVGSEIVVLGYPFAPLGSFLETWTPGYITARARRQVVAGLEVEELVLSNVAHPGSSGSAVFGRNDGVLYGILRGALAPPEVLRIGDIPIATDTSVTFATSAHLLHDTLRIARETLDQTT